jgi:hypothetical protein
MLLQLPLLFSCILSLQLMMKWLGRSRQQDHSSINLQRAGQMGQRTIAEWLERDMINAYILSPDSALSPLFLGDSSKLGIFLKAMRKQQPKLLVITEQESNLNGCNGEN